MENTEYKNKIKHWKKSYVFSNGLRFWYRQTETLTSKLYSIFDAGSKHDGTKLGLAHFTEHLLFDGNSEMTSDALKLFAAERGLDINAGTGKEFMMVQVENIFPEYITDAVEIVYQTTINADFNGEDFDREKNVVLSEIADANDKSYYVALTQCDGLVLDSAYKFPILGFKETVAKLTKDDVKQFHVDNFLPQSTIICYAGSLPAEDVLDIIAKRFEKWQVNESHALTYKPEAILNDNIGFDVNTEGMGGFEVLFQNKVEKTSQNQVVVVFGYPGVTIADDDKIALSLACDIFGGLPMMNRMFKRLREDQGLCYWTQSYNHAFSDAKGLIGLSGSTSKENYKQYIASLLNLIKEVQTERPFTEEELKMSKQLSKSNLANLFDSFGASSSLFTFEWIGKGVTSIYAEEEAIEKIDLETVQAVFNKYLSVTPQIVTVGNFKEDDANQKQIFGIRPVGERSSDPNKIAPTYIAKPIENKNNQRVEEINDGIEGQTGVKDEQDEVQSEGKALTVDDSEMGSMPLVESICKNCGKPFKHLELVNVSLCPDCKVAAIQGTGRAEVKRVAVNSSSLDVSMKKASSGAKSKGKDYGAKAGSKLKPAHRPQAASGSGKSKGDESGSSSGSDKAGGKQKFKPTGKAASDSVAKAADEAAEKKLDDEAELEARGAEAADGKGSVFNPEDHPRDNVSGQFIDG